MPQPGESSFLIFGGIKQDEQTTTRIRTALNALAGVTLALGICAVQSALADEGTFTVASLQGRYAYVNNTEGVASFGPMSSMEEAVLLCRRQLTYRVLIRLRVVIELLIILPQLAPTQLTRMGRGLLRSHSSLLTAPLSAPRYTTS